MGKLIVNGFVLPLVKHMKLRLEVDEGGQDLESIKVEVAGGQLHVKNPHGPAMHVIAQEGGNIRLTGKDCALLVENRNAPDTAAGLAALYLEGTGGITLTPKE